MSKPLSAGQCLLAAAAATYRANPASWAQGWGVRSDGIVIDFDPDSGTIKSMTSCCIDVMLKKLAPQYGGAPAVVEARRRLYLYMQVPHERKRIWEYNDADGRRVDQVVALLEMAAGFRLLRLDEMHTVTVPATAPLAIAA